MAEGRDLQAIKEVGDRLDGKCAQVTERGEVSVELLLSDPAIIRGGSREPSKLSDVGSLSFDQARPSPGTADRLGGLGGLPGPHTLQHRGKPHVGSGKLLLQAPTVQRGRPLM
jgi:hypothetical protein